MITLHRDKARKYEVGEVLHLKVVSLEMNAPGRWRLTVEDITPLPGAMATHYACGVCGGCEEAKPDGSLPEGWTAKEYEEGAHWVCGESCREEQMCRVCGCTQMNACLVVDDGLGGKYCSWVEVDLCSACA